MTSVDAYLERVRRGLAGMDATVRTDILRELRSHLTDSVATNGGDVGAAVASLGDPALVAKRYRDLYGFGVPYRAGFVAIAGILSVLTVPSLFPVEDFLFPVLLPTIFLGAEVAFLIWVSVVAGNRAGLVAGVAGLVARLGAFGLTFTLQAAQPLVTIDGFALFAFVSILLPVIGWAPGRARRAWRGPAVDL